MIIENILGNIRDFSVLGKFIDEVSIEWYEVNKRILKKESKNGKEIGIKLEKTGKLQEGDILFMDEKEVIVLSILPCEVISIVPDTMEAMGRICYEIGNKHIPVFFHNDKVLVAFDDPLMKLLDKLGYNPQKSIGKLVNGLGQNAHSHGHSHSHGDDNDQHQHGHDHRHEDHHEH